MESLPVMNGPAMQLLVLVLRFVIMLRSLVRVAIMTTGIRSRLCTSWTMLNLRTLGRCRLINIILGRLLRITIKFRLLAAVLMMWQFLLLRKACRMS